jgi:glycosyltransferase involved in cell wall biosynthesis
MITWKQTNMTDNLTKLSVTIITKNEERNIRRCLESVKWADEIIVLDSGSQDKTEEICREYTSKVYPVEWLGFGKTKQKAVEMASHEWILSIDADEELTPQLIEAIQKKISESDKCDGYEIKRISQYLGKWIRFSGWNRDYPLRLFKKDNGHFNEKLVHESVILTGKRGKIHKPMLHYTYPDIETHLRKIDVYSECWAQEKANRGKKGTLTSTLLHTGIKFVNTYFFKLGFMDGKIGFILSINAALSAYMKHLKLWEKTKNKKINEG